MYHDSLEVAAERLISFMIREREQRTHFIEVEIDRLVREGSSLGLSQDDSDLLDYFCDLILESASKTEKQCYRTIETLCIEFQSVFESEALVELVESLPGHLNFS